MKAKIIKEETELKFKRTIFKIYVRTSLIVLFLISLPFLVIFQLSIIRTIKQLWCDTDAIYEELEDIV
jgi:hypothetical protein